MLSRKYPPLDSIIAQQCFPSFPTSIKYLKPSLPIFFFSGQEAESDNKAAISSPTFFFFLDTKNYVHRIWFETGHVHVALSITMDPILSFSSYPFSAVLLRHWPMVWQQLNPNQSNSYIYIIANSRSIYCLATPLFFVHMHDYSE